MIARDDGSRKPRLVSLVAYIGWLVTVCMFGAADNFWSGPYWLVGRGSVPTAMGFAALGSFAVVGVVFVWLNRWSTAFLSLLLLPNWLAAGVFLNNLADW